MRRSTYLRAAVTAVAATAVVAGPAAAAPPERDVVDVSSAEYEALVAADISGLCGFAISVEGKGHVRTIRMAGDRQLRSLEIYATRFVFTADGRSVTIRDTGPDRVVVRDGVELRQLIGRSTTGSGTIGRTVVVEETGEELFRKGRTLEDPLQGVCTALRPR